MTYLTVSNVSQEPSNHYAYQAVHFYGELLKWFRQQLIPWRPLLLGSLEKASSKCPSFISLHHLLILGRPRILVSKQPADALLPYGLCVVLPFQQRTCTHVHTIYHYSWQSKMPHLKASLTKQLCKQPKTDPFKYGAKSTLGYEQSYLPSWGSTIFYGKEHQPSRLASKCFATG